MRYTVSLLIVATVTLLAGATTAAADDEASAFFTGDVVQEIHLTFDDPDWYDTLWSSHANDPDDPYFPARFACGDLVLDPIGVRFKGNSSFSIGSGKKSIKLDFAEYVEDSRFFGLKKLNLNNGFKDPSMLREKLFLEIAGEFVPTIRAVFARIYINGTYWGLYTAVEQVDKTFVQSRFGGSEDGNLWKGAASDDAGGPQSDFGSDLTWLGSDPDAYHDSYQLKTNEEADDYSQLIEMINILNHTDAGELPAALEPIFDVDTALAGLALNNLFVNLDSYNGSAHNYYLYDRDDNGLITHLHWDANEAFGRFLMYVSMGTDAVEMDPFWLPEGGSGPGMSGDQSRPLMANLWEVDSYRSAYLCSLSKMLGEQHFDPDRLAARITELADLIRDDVYADTNKAYSDSQFEQNLTSDVRDGRDTIYGLQRFIDDRASYLQARLNQLGFDCVNEAPVISGTTRSPARPSASRTATVTAKVSDDGWLSSTRLRWRLAGGSFSELAMSGVNGGSFSASLPGQTAGSQVEYYLVAEDDQGLVTTDPADAPASIYTYRVGDAAPLLYLNELMAKNETTVQDPDGTGYPDWFEIYNPSSAAVDMGGMFLTDDPDEPTRWQVPAGVVIEAGSFLLLWADNDEEQGKTHTSFKLSAGGDQLALVDADGETLLDSVEFAEQTADISYGRATDGASQWVLLSTPTPGSSNSGTQSAVASSISLPAVARVQGAGAFFTSQVDLLNLDDESLAVTATYTPRLDFGGESLSTVVSLQGRQALSVDDALGTWFGISNAAAGSLMLQVDDAARQDDLVVQSLVLARGDDGSEYGQFFPATAEADALAAGETAYLSSTVDAERTRVNFGAMALEDGTVLTVQPVAPIGSALASARTISLDRGVSTQINDLNNGSNGFALGQRANYLLEVTVTAGRAVVYTSVLDGNGDVAGTNDPTTMLPVRRGSQRVTLLELGPVQGVNEYAGSASISNLSAFAAVVDAELFLRDSPGVAASTTISVPAGDTVGYLDLVGELFGTSGVGSVVLTVRNNAEIFAVGREYAVLRDQSGEITGTAGQLIPGMSDDELLQPGTTAHLIGLPQQETASGSERSHVAVFNPGEERVTVSLQLYDGTSGAWEGETSISVRSQELVQVNNIISRIFPDQNGGSKRLQVEVDGPVFLKAFRVNASGDPVTIDPVER